jgi:E3 ubiquitin-protein ligase DOA10
MSTNLSLSEGTCKICFDQEPIHDLISPCNCKGSVVHSSCLYLWRVTREDRFKTCEVCKFNYEFEPKYDYYRLIKYWWPLLVSALIFIAIIDTLRSSIVLIIYGLWMFMVYKDIKQNMHISLKIKDQNRQVKRLGTIVPGH